MNKNFILNLFFIGIFLFYACTCCGQLNSLPTENETLIKSPKKLTSQQPRTTFQSPYELTLKREVSLFSLGFGIQIAGLSILKNIEPLTVADIERLNPAAISSFDRKTVNHYSTSAQSTSDILLFGSMTLPLVLMADKNMRKDFLKIGSMASQALLLNTGLTTLAKGTAKRTRPYAYNPAIPIEKKLSESTRMSFFSGHTSTVSVMSFFTAKVFADYHPDSKWKPVVWTAAAIIPATTGYLRYKGGKHYPTDVLVGYGVGAAIGILIPHLHRSNKNKQFRLSPMASNDAVGLSLRGVF